MKFCCGFIACLLAFYLPAFAQSTIPGKAVVKFSSQAAANEALEAFQQSYSGSSHRFPFALADAPEGRTNKQGQPFVDIRFIAEVNFPPTIQLENVFNFFLFKGAIYAEPVYQHQPLTLPNDPLLSNQQLAYLNQIKATEAWAFTTGSDNLTMAIIDAGTTHAHPEFINRIAYNTADPVNGIDDDGNGYIDDFVGWNFSENNNNPTPTNNGHGNIISSIAMAQANNGFGISGLTHQGKFIPVKVFGTQTLTYEGVFYAAQRQADILNLSWGRNTGAPSQFEQDIINYAAINNDAIVVAAGGNIGGEVTYYPAIYNNLLSVAHVMNNDERHSSTSYNYRIDLAAPGVGIFAINNALPTPGFGTVGVGSSNAAPMVSATALLIKALHSSLSAFEVRELIRANTDNIYNLPLNSQSPGMLGTGRLNMFRAVSRSNNRSVRLLNANLISRFGGEQWHTGDTLSLIGHFHNVLSSISGVNITATVINGSLSGLSNTWSPGTLPANASFNNQQNPFRFIIQGSGINQRATIRLTITGANNYRTEEFVDFEINPSYVHLSNNQITTTVSSMGAIGLLDNLNKEGKGINFRNSQHLAECGLMIGKSANQVSNAVSDTLGKHRHFAPASTPRFTAPLTVRSSFTDDAAFQPLKLHITQTTKAFNTAGAKNGFLVEFEILNQDTITHDSLLVGLFLNWALDNPNQNRIQYDTINKLGYTYSLNQSNPLYGGIAPIGNAKSSFFAFEQGVNIAGNINTMNGFSNAEKYQSLNGGRKQAGFETPTGANVMSTTSSRLYNFAPGQRRKLAFYIGIDTSLIGLKNNLTAIRNQAQSSNRGPIPSVPNLSTCVNGTINLIPSGGGSFNFYNSPALGTPIASGRFLRLENLTQPTQIWVTNTDSLFESQPTVATIQVNGIPATWQATPVSLNLSIGNNATFSAQPGADAYTWDFGNGMGATTPTASTIYTTAGDYPVQLITTIGTCSDTLTRIYRVLSVTSNSSLEDNQLNIYPVPASKTLHIKGLTGISSTTWFDLSGRKLNSQAHSRKGDLTLSDLPSQSGIYLLEIKTASITHRRLIPIK